MLPRNMFTAWGPREIDLQPAHSACRFCSKKTGQNRAAIRRSFQGAGTRALLRTEKFLEGLHAVPEILGRLQSFSPKSGCWGVGWGTN